MTSSLSTAIFNTFTQKEHLTDEVSTMFFPIKYHVLFYAQWSNVVSLAIPPSPRVPRKTPSRTERKYPTFRVITANILLLLVG